jgi:hypothetical protein
MKYAEEIVLVTLLLVLGCRQGNFPDKRRNDLVAQILVGAQGCVFNKCDVLKLRKLSNQVLRGGLSKEFVRSVLGAPHGVVDKRNMWSWITRDFQDTWSYYFLLPHNEAENTMLWLMFSFEDDYVFSCTYLEIPTRPGSL